MKNRLIDSSSPYLRQHADNPVNWFPWSDEALDLSKKTDKPILLSIGYAACHWCHVMAHESFEDNETAALMNEHFICIKVDREERPDLDQIYMTFIQMTTGEGGWPLNVFLTPDLEPFYAGTYFPPADRYGRPAWKKVLHSVSRFYNNDKTSLNTNLEKIRQAYTMTIAEKSGDTLPGLEDLTKCAHALAGLYDPDHGGLGKAPKFPAIQPLAYFLYHYHRTGDTRFLQMTTRSLEKMARGGIYDQIGGGFARYSVDDRWLVPHFEKMLYDNAQMAILYLDAYLITGNQLFKDVVHSVLEFTRTELRHPGGGFYSSLDADSEGVEGKYYTWSKAEIDALLDDKSRIFCHYYGVTEQGNFDGTNILHIADSLDGTAKRFNMHTADVKSVLDQSAEILKRIRAERIRPGLDDKILTSWNSLMLSAYARALQVFDNPVYQMIVEENIDFIRLHLTKDDRLFRSFNRGKSGIPAFLDDYAYLIRALLDVYETTFSDQSLSWAYELLQQVNRRFYDEQHGGYFYTTADHRRLIYRLKDLYDQSTPAANGVMLQNLLRFHSITEDPDLLLKAEEIMRRQLPECRSNPYAFGSYLLAMDYYMTRPYEIVVMMGDNQTCADLLKPVFGRFLPNRIMILGREPTEPAIISGNLLAGRGSINGKPTVYICHAFTCSPPITEATELEQFLQSGLSEKES